MQTKSTLFPNRYQYFSKFWVFFGEKKTDFRPKKCFSAKLENGHFSVIPTRTRSVVILGHFLMAWTVPPSFVDDGPKLRVLILTKCYKPEMAKNQGEPRKMTHSSETEVLLHPLKKWIFGPKRARFLAQIWHFWLNISIFGPFGPMPDQKTMGARCLGVFSVTWVPKVLLPPIKIRIFGPKTAIFAPKSNMLS